MKSIKVKSSQGLAKALKISESRALEARFKVQLILAISKEVENRDLTHLQVAELSGQPRSAITGILSGSLQKVTLDRLLRIAEAVGLTVEWKIRHAS